MKFRDKVNLLIDLLLFVALVGIAGIGFLIKYTLPPGRERILRYGDNRELALLGMDRHQWGSIHLVIALIMLGLLILHILFHWQTILCLVRKAVPLGWLRHALWVTTGVLCLFFFLFAFLFVPVRLETGDFMYRNASPRIEKFPSGKSQPAGEVKKEQVPEITVLDRRGQHWPAGDGHVSGLQKKEVPQTAELDCTEKHLHGVEDHDSLNGRMTLDEVASHYGVSTIEVKRRLGIPVQVPGAETLGRLRKTYGFTMQEARDRMGKAL